MHPPRVSVVIPVYDDLDTLSRAVESVLSQTFSVFEIIVVDDGSPRDVPSALGPHSKSVRIFRHPENRGASAARNTGIRESQGDYVALLDADDVWRPNKLEQQIELMTERSDIGACATGFAIHRAGSGATEEYPVHVGANFADELIWGCKISPGSTLVVRRECYDRAGLYDEQLLRLEDWDWLLRFSRHYRIASVSAVLADIYLAGTPGPDQLEQVLGAVDHLREKHLAYFSKLGGWRSLKFLSTLMVERAAAYYRAGNHIRAVTLTLASFFMWPFQTGPFFTRLSRSVRRIFR